MRTACHNILYTQANSVAVSAAADTSPYWLMMLVVLDTAVLCAALFVLLGRRGVQLKLPAKIGTVAVVGLVLALIFYFAFFRTGGTAASDPAQGTPSAGQSSAPSQQPSQQSPAPSDSAVMTLTGTGGGWLVCNVTLLEDNTFTVAFDYNAENSGIQTDSGTWVRNDDNSITLTGEKRTFTAISSDGVNYTMDVENVETGIVCTVTGSMAS